MMVAGMGHSGGGGAKEVGLRQCEKDQGTRKPPFYRARVGGEAVAGGVMVVVKWSFNAPVTGESKRGRHRLGEGKGSGGQRRTIGGARPDSHGGGGGFACWREEGEDPLGLGWA
jgi:hypothetical protein